VSTAAVIGRAYPPMQLLLLSLYLSLSLQSFLFLRNMISPIHLSDFSKKIAEKQFTPRPLPSLLWSLHFVDK